MVRSLAGAAGVGLVLGASAVVPQAPAQQAVKTASAAGCRSLAALKLPNATITLATEVPAGTFTAPAGADGGNGGRGANVYPTLAAFCRVAGVSKPSPDSTINFEVWMPLQGWNERFQGVGNGGFAGSISYPSLAAAVAAGYAAGSTDTGHGPEGGMNAPNWALGHPERIIDFGYRAVHEMTEKSKAVVAAFYAVKPRFSYWIGCSEGGRQGMGEAQRYPADYDGIVTGAPVFGFTRTQTRTLSLQKILREDPSSFIPGSKLRFLHQAILNQCDALDGVKDGVLTDPRMCKIDYAPIECKAGDKPDCLTRSQIKLFSADMAGSANPRTGERLMWGHSPGVELMQAARTKETPDADTLPSGFWRYFVFEDPKWDGHTFDFDKDVAFADKKVGAAMNNFDPDLRPFKARGGKLIHYHGWSDPQPSPLNSIDYFERVQKAVGGDTGDFYRLFMVPGMSHCSGGPGTDQFDKVAAIRAWVEQGKAPDMILAQHMTNGVADRQRPLCPHPKVATYKGSGNTDDAANFVCAMPGGMNNAGAARS